MRTIVAAILLVTSFAFAAGLPDAQALYTKGEFQKAAETAVAAGGADGFAFAAKANSIFATTRPAAEQEPLYVKSESYANQAIKIDAKNDDGYFELARAIGRLSQLRGVLAALTQGLGTKVKENLDKALGLNPKNASAWVALGLWHAEIVAKGVGFLYGADGGKVAPAMEKAIALEPDQIIHRVEYAKALMLLDAKNKPKAIELLEKAVTLKVNDVAEGLDLERAKKDLAALK
jgi:tetratricopeptide (TPR) repeat protein